MELYKLSLTTGLLILFGGILIITQAESCNDIACASIVSKCMSIQNCQCEPKNCPCDEEFRNCLGDKYSKACCSCVELCPPKPNRTRNALSKKSHVEEFDGVPELFNALLTSKSEEFEWDIVTFPVEFDDDIVADHDLDEVIMEYWDDTLEEERDHNIQVNCSVLYMSSCISWNKCRQSCQTLGARSYRWFHDGCCECVGPTCINYGINDSRCKRCPEAMDDDADVDEIDDELENSDEEMDLFQFL